MATIYAWFVILRYHVSGLTFTARSGWRRASIVALIGEKTPNVEIAKEL
jgi:hypothetical protein